MKEYITTCGFTMTYVCRRRRRKTAQLRMDPDEGLILSVPVHWSDDQVERLLEEKKGWILEKKKLLSHQKMSMPPFVLAEGEQLLLAGRFYPLHIDVDPDTKPFFYFDRDGFYLRKRGNDPDAKLKDLVVDWYKQQSQYLLEERVAFYQDDIAGKPLLVKAKEQKKRWGSCTCDNKLLFNWRLIFAPEFVIDSVVVHELCHMIHKNHSKDFWNLVHAVYPEYKESKEWLKKYGHRLFWID